MEGSNIELMAANDNNNDCQTKTALVADVAPLTSPKKPAKNYFSTLSSIANPFNTKARDPMEIQVTAATYAPLPDTPIIRSVPVEEAAADYRILARVSCSPTTASPMSLELLDSSGASSVSSCAGVSHARTSPAASPIASSNASPTQCDHHNHQGSHHNHHQHKDYHDHQNHDDNHHDQHQNHHNQDQKLSTTTNTNLLHPNRPMSTSHQSQQEQRPQPPTQKLRSFSHSTTFPPVLEKLDIIDCRSPSAKSDGRGSASELLSAREDQENDEHQQPQSADRVIVGRPRRLSRIEHRQSLLELGYGKIESYFKLQRLGKGTYATVYMGRSRLSNDLVALKEILKEHDEGAPCTAIREVSLLRLLRHSNIVTLHDICHMPKKLTLVFEYVGPDLYAYMKENNNLLSMHNVRLLLYQLLRGISFCHSRHVLHRDLKPQNLLINSRGELKICDFGLARAKSIPTKSYSNEVVTLWYRPPDVLLGNTDYDHSIDMWGVGCIFYEMASGRTFFPGSSVRQQLYLIFSSLGAPNKYNWPEILTNPEYQSYSFPPFRPEKLSHRLPRLDSNGIVLLMSFLRFKPSERISAEEARRDPFFACLPEAVHRLNERESIFDVPGVYMTLNLGQKMNHRA